MSSRLRSSGTPRATVAWMSQVLPKMVTTGVRASSRPARFGSFSGENLAMCVDPKAASLAFLKVQDRISSKNFLSVGLEPGQPPSMYSYAQVVQLLGYANLVLGGQVQFFGLGSVPQSGVVYGDVFHRLLDVFAFLQVEGFMECAYRQFGVLVVDQAGDLDLRGADHQDVHRSHRQAPGRPWRPHRNGYACRRR